ncbi:MAG: NAD(+) synthase [Verrucomicrobia bacterium]|nr:NAD(+) synthase [Verrucomicrobiota bacterium]
MKLIKVGAAALNQTALDWENNQRNILGAIREARAARVSILCLPELAITGYGCEDAFHSPSVHQIAWEVLQEILPATKGIIVAVGLPVFHQNALFNTACVVANGKIIGFTAKQNLAGDGIHYEPRFFKPWPRGLTGTVRVGGKNYPIGDLHYDFDGVTIGFEICEDAWVCTRPGSELALQGVDIILNPSASHFAFGKHAVRQRFVQEGSRAFGVSYVYANLLGNDAGRVIYDGGAMIATQGRLVALGPRFSFADWKITAAVVDVEATRMNQARTASFKPKLAETSKSCVAARFSFPAIHSANESLSVAEWESSPQLKEEEFSRSVALGLFDYVRKSRSRGFVVSISGGADSAAVSCLVHLAAVFGIGEIGAENFHKKLPWLAKLNGKDAASTARVATRQLLTCVYQATRNSSSTTRNAAKAVADGLNAEFFELDIDPLVRQYAALVEGALGRRLSWARDDVALQNIQARVRSPGVWMLANIKGALLVSTSNRSEAAVGYATMDGDTSGGLSPIAGIDKAFLRRWLRWLERAGPRGAGAFPFLDKVNKQAPTAELRPAANKQTDEDDLMPYDLLDAIERAAIRDKHRPREVFEQMQAMFPQYSAAQLRVWVERFFRLWCRNQWKRERYAPSFHVDDENLDPKTWCRFPILSGGYARELAELPGNRPSSRRK